MKQEDNRNIDAGQYKGILPVHMRQGMPPYLQILFAAREPIPYVAPIKKPHKLEIRSCLGDLDIKEAFKRVEQNKRLREEHEREYLERNSKEVPRALKRQKKLRTWTENMEKHIHQRKAEYKRWISEELKSSEGKTGDPYKTLIVSNLVR